MPAQIAGQFINSVGGFIGFTPFGGTWGAAGNRTPEFALAGNTVPPNWGGATMYLDCATWTKTPIPFFDDTTNTGSYGCQNQDLVAEGWEASAEVIVDQRYPPDMIAKYGVAFGKNAAATGPANQQFGFNLGCRVILIQGCGVNTPADQVIDFWWCPSAKSVATPIIDAGGKKNVRMTIDLTGNAPLYKMPAQCNLAADFIRHCGTRDWVF